MRNTPRTRCHKALLALGLLAVLLLGGTWNALEAAPSADHLSPAPAVAAPVHATPALRHDPTHAAVPAPRQEISDKEYAQAFRERVAKTLERLRTIKAARAEREARRAMQATDVVPVETAAATPAPNEPAPPTPAVEEARPPVAPTSVEEYLPAPEPMEAKAPSKAIEIPLAGSATPEPVATPALKPLEIPLAAPVLPQKKPVAIATAKSKAAVPAPSPLPAHPKANSTTIEPHATPTPVAQPITLETATPAPAAQVAPVAVPEPLTMTTPTDYRAPVMESKSDLLFQKALSKMEKGKSRRMELARKAGIVLPSQGGDMGKVSPALSHLNQAVKVLINKLP